MKERLEAALEWGGVKKDVVCIIASAVALAVSFMSAGSLPVDPAWLAILLCGVPIVCEATLTVVYEHDIKADLLEVPLVLRHVDADVVGVWRP